MIQQITAASLPRPAERANTRKLRQENILMMMLGRNLTALDLSRHHKKSLRMIANDLREMIDDQYVFAFSPSGGSYRSRSREGGGTAELGDELQSCLRASGGGGDKPHVLIHADPIARCVTAGEDKRQDWETCNFVAHSLRGEGFDASETGPLDTDGGTQAVSYAIQAGALRTNPNSGADGVGVQADHAYTLEARAEAQAVAFQERGREGGRSLEVGGDVAYALTAPKGGGRAQERNVLTPAMNVRRLTPAECARLQGFPDDYLDIPYRGKPAADGPKYKALGNSWAVPCVTWIGQRIAASLE